MESLVEWVCMVALAFGATFAAWTLEACTDIATIVCRRLWPKMLPGDIAMVGGAIFMFLMVGLPVLAVLWGFATGRLPGKPF